MGLHPILTSRGSDLLQSDALILPGVGAFGDAMRNLRQLGLVDPIKEFAASGKPFFGICLGMQLLFSKSGEFGECSGLGLLEGEVVRFPAGSVDGRKIKIPQAGWNRIFSPSQAGLWQGTPLENIGQGEFMYFIHSFYAVPARPENILAVSDYEGVRYCCAAIQNNIFAAQFHPEKSAREGLKIYQYWANRILNGSGV